MRRKKTEQAKLLALKALTNEVELIRELVQINIAPAKSQSGVNGFSRMPTLAFETAFVSGDSIVNVHQELLNTVTRYLAKAYSINGYIELHFCLAGGPGNIQSEHAQYTREDIKHECEELLTDLKQLRVLLLEELDRMSNKN